MRWRYACDAGTPKPVRTKKHKEATSCIADLLGGIFERHAPYEHTSPYLIHLRVRDLLCVWMYMHYSISRPAMQTSHNTSRRATKTVPQRVGSDKAMKTFIGPRTATERQRCRATVIQRKDDCIAPPLQKSGEPPFRTGQNHAIDERGVGATVWCLGLISGGLRGPLSRRPCE